MRAVLVLALGCRIWQYFVDAASAVNEGRAVAACPSVFFVSLQTQTSDDVSDICCHSDSETHSVKAHFIRSLNLYLHSRYCIKTEYGFTEFFDTVTSVCQGYVLSPFLFFLEIDSIMQKATCRPNMGIHRTDSTSLSELDFAVDPSSLPQSRDTLEDMS